MTDRQQLVDASISLIAGHQAPGGAYPASPTYPTYKFCWFRDASFTARAMDVFERFDSSGAFHDWASATILAHSPAARRAIEAGPTSGVLHTRYLLDGTAGDTEWANFQLDGFGTWLWALQGHVADSDAGVSPVWKDAADLVADYLEALWDRPCFDLWEENPGGIHPYTLGAIHAGLKAHQVLTGASHAATIDAVSDLIQDRGIVDGRLVKTLGSDDIDASLVALGVPYGVFDPERPIMQRTVEAIEERLTDGGVHRYRRDTFYGGGQWILLTAWLAWHHRHVGNRLRADRLLEWVERQADAELRLPEQVSDQVNDPSSVQPWVDRWGPVAKPLLWSHAMYLLAVAEERPAR